jgi:hypothetical protein
VWSTRVGLKRGWELLATGVGDGWGSVIDTDGGACVGDGLGEVGVSLGWATVWVSQMDGCGSVRRS